MAETSMFDPLRGTFGQKATRILLLVLAAFGIISVMGNMTPQYLGKYGSMFVLGIGAVVSTILYTYSKPTVIKPSITKDLWLAIVIIIIVYFIAVTYPKAFPLTFSLIGS